MTTSLKNELDNIVGKTYEYQKRTIKILSYKNLSSGYIIVKTTARTHNFLPQEIDDFLKEIIPVATELVEQKKTKLPELPTAYSYQKSDIHIKLENSLSDMIDKVNTDAKIIPQATALCNIANTLVNIEKQQINMLKATGQI